MKRVVRTAVMILAPMLLTVSCGLMDMEQEETVATEMSLDRDTVYIMVGDQFTLTPRFSPATDALAYVYWSSSADSVVSISDNVFTGLSEGWSMVRATSVSGLLQDSCWVGVMPRWEPTVRQYPYEMLVYAEVTVHGLPFNPETMILGAFVDDEMRGSGELMTWKGRQYVRIRVGSDISYVDPNGVNETVSFRVYLKQQLRFEEFPQTLDFDGEAHGTLTNLYKISL